MLVFLFYHASVFDFPKYKKLYIALCHRERMPDSLNCQKFPPETDRYDPKLVSVPVFRCFDTPVSGKSQNAAPPRQRSATANELEHWKMQEYVLIYQSGEKKIVSTSVKVAEVQNAGTTGEKRKSSNGKNLSEPYLCRTGISGVYLLVSRKSNHRKT